MLFSTTFVAAFAALAVAKPIMLKPRAAVLADTTYDAISISGGTAGNAEEEALAVFSTLDLTDMANVDPADIEFLGAVNDVANDAEKEGFNTAIDAATGEEATALEVSLTVINGSATIFSKLTTQSRMARSRTKFSSSWPPSLSSR